MCQEILALKKHVYFSYDLSSTLIDKYLFGGSTYFLYWLVVTITLITPVFSELRAKGLFNNSPFIQ